MKHSKKVISGFIALSMAMSIAAPAELISLSDVLTVNAAQVGQKLTVGNGQTQHKEDNVDGYSYEIWLDNTGGSGSMTLGSGGTFSTDWSASVSRGNFLARRGRNYDATKKATEYGPIVMDYAADYSASSQGNSRLCVYGWMKNPLVEYYIIEDWVNWCPSPNGQSKTVTIDGAEYEIFQLDHTGPTILGTNETFKQYFSVRKSKRTSGTITVSDHFKAWAAAGWNIGNLTEVALNVEGWESSGKANVTKLTIGTGSSENNNNNNNNNQNPSTNTSQPSADSLKGKFADCFRIGTSVSPHELGQGGDFIKKHFNSITPENELKPDALLSPGSDNTRAKVSLSKAASTLKFCEQNGIALRGHTFVWYSQTPDWFFRENFSQNGAYVSKDIMNQRLENFIKDTFDLLAKEYPKLEVYAYDVCNELFLNDGGGLRPGSNSGWTKVYGDTNDEFIINAFTYARKYAPKGCKLYINDYNEYIPAKTNDIYSIAMKLKELGVIDGIGMQSHLDVKYPSAEVYKTGLEKFLSTGLDVQITELDITCGTDFNSQAKLFADVFQMAVDHADQIPAVTVWGTNDSISWRRENNPLLFSQGYQPKKAYESVMAIDTSSVKQSTPASQAPASQTPASQTPASQAPASQAPAQTTDFTFGDINDDTKIDITDLSLLAVHLIDKTKFTDKQTLASDVAYNGTVELADLATLRQFISKVIDKLGEGYVAPAKQSPSPSPSKAASPSPSPSPSKAPETPATFTSTGKTFSVGNGQNQHKADNVDGYSYEIWLDNTGGSGSMTLGSGGTFTTDWSAQVSRGNFLARRGRNYDATKKATEYGPIVMDYAA
ncbi:MAG: endo-1,4-beta-xylanase, partial [Oscillospiraceae bacterium]|nr:endo-1,4-beta-xylanase [Oscillospiraceae bacterium]